MLAEIAEDPAARAGYEDALRREELLAALVRARRSRSQQAVAATMSTTQSAVSDIENGRVDPRLSTLQRYARAVEHRLEFALCAQDSAAFELAYEPQLAKEAIAWAAQRSIAGIMADLHVHEPTSGPQSPASVAERTGLPEPTVEYDMDRLKRTGWLNSSTPPQSREPHYSLSRSRGLALGVSVNRDHIDAVLTNLHNEPLMSLQNQLPNTSPRTVVKMVADLVQELQRNVGLDQEIVGVTVTVAGRVDGSVGTVYFAPDLQTPEHSWRDIPLQAELTDAIRRRGHGPAEIQVVVENDANTLGMHEDPEGQAQSIAVVLLSEGGEGIGGGLVVNGGIVRGSGGVSGEIGHIVVDPGGGPCRYGTRGCLETVASAAAIVRRIQAKVAPVKDLNEAADLAARGDRAAIAVFKDAGEALGRVLSSVTAIAGPQRFVIFGPPQLTKESDLPSARVFVGGVRRAHGYYGISDVKVDIEARVLNHEVLPSAAAATAARNFLLAPGHALAASVSPAAGASFQIRPAPAGVGLAAAATTARSRV